LAHGTPRRQSPYKEHCIHNIGESASVCQDPICFATRLLASAVSVVPITSTRPSGYLPGFFKEHRAQVALARVGQHGHDEPALVLGCSRCCGCCLRRLFPSRPPWLDGHDLMSFPTNPIRNIGNRFSGVKHFGLSPSRKWLRPMAAGSGPT